MRERFWDYCLPVLLLVGLSIPWWMSFIFTFAWEDWTQKLIIFWLCYNAWNHQLNAWEDDWRWKQTLRDVAQSRQRP